MRTPRHRFALASALAAICLLAAAACGGDDDEDGGDADSSPAASATDGGAAGAGGTCELVTAEEAAEVLGEPVSEGEEGSTPPYDSCTYNVESLAVKFVLVQVRDDVSLEAFRSSIQDAAEFLGEEPETVSGVGDAAYNLAGLLYAHEGNTEVVMSVVLGPGQTDESVLEAEKELAIIALDRAG
jgi:hypothetical protein